MILHWLAAAGVLALLTMAPGPDMAVVTRRSLVGGRSDALRAAGGVVCGLLVWGSLAVLGLTALLTAAPGVYLALKVVGVAYLLLLAARALRGRGHDEVGGAPAPARGRPFLTGLATNVLNPKIAVFYTALLPTLAPSSSGARGMAALVLVHCGLTVAWLGGYAYALDRARSLLTRPRVRRALDRATGVVLVGFAVRLAADGA